MALNPTPFTVGQVLTSTAVNNLPMGIVDSVSATATTGITGGTTLAVLSKSITIASGRRYRVNGYLGFQPSANTNGNFLWFSVTGGISKFLWGRADIIPANYPQYVGGSYITTATELGVTSGSSAKTFTLNLRCAGNGSLNTNPDGVVGADSAVQSMWIEDIGAA